MNRIVSLCGVVTIAAMLPACATVTRGTSQTYRITSQPTAAEVTLSTGQTCITPCEMKLKRRPGFTATVKKAGYKTQTATVESKLGGGGAVAGAGNIIAGGLIGGIVDGSNGSMNNLYPNPLAVTLLPEAVAPVTSAAVPTAAEPVAPAPAPTAPTTTSDASKATPAG